MIGSLILEATVTAAQTPQAAALIFLQPRTTHSHPQVRVTGVNGRYAIVHFTGAVIESTPAAGYLLAQKFSFGWQPIDLSIDNKPLSLLPGNASNRRDVGPAADVEAVRAQGAGLAEIIPFVRVVDGYAFMEWWGWGGGENFYKRTPRGWKQFMGGGGAASVNDLMSKGVPIAIAKALLKQ